MPSYRAPTPEQVEAALLKIPTFQLRRVFYEGLENPLWLRPLKTAGAFSNPPEPEATGDGYLRDTYWPELTYLERVAPEAPDEVVDVLLQLEKSTNGWVRRAVFEIGSQIPAGSSVRLEPLLKAWLPTGFGWRTDSHALVSLAVRLLEEGQEKVGRWLANALFAPRESDDSSGIRKPELLLDEYWYEVELPNIVPALGANALHALTGWLKSYVIASGHASAEHDFSAMDRPSIETRSDSNDRPEDALVEAVRDAAIPAMREDPGGTLALLVRPGIKLLRKIALYVVAEAIRLDLQDGATPAHLVQPAKALLSDSSSDDTYLRVEYARLAQELVRVDAAATSVVTQFLEDAYASDLEWMRQRLVQGDGTPEQFEESIREKANRYKHGWLSAIGAAALPPDLRETLAQLDATNGVIDDPLEPLGQVTSWSGPNPHTSHDEMVAMAPAELVIHLASWHDNGDGWGPEPSHEGQGRALSGLLTTDPKALRGVQWLTALLRPTYVRAILQGWESALKADLEPDWSQVAELIAEVLNHPLESTFAIEGGNFDDDLNYRGAKDAAVDLLEELVKKRSSAIVPDAYVELFAKLLIQDANDESAWVEYDAYQHEGSGWDPLNMSLNWQWPSRVRGLIFAATSFEGAPWRDSALAAIEFEACRIDQHGAGRAALGQGFGRLLSSAPGWLTTHLELLVGTRSSISTPQQIVLTTAIATHRYNRAMCDVLKPSILAAIEVGESLAAGWNGESDPLPRIGEWIVDAVIFDDMTTEDELFQSFFALTTPEVRGDALSKIAWSFLHAKDVDEAIRDRFAGLWDDRIRYVQAHPEDSKELKGIYWLAKSPAFSADWWLPRLREALVAEPTIVSERYMIGKELAEASVSDPAVALAVLKLLLDGRAEGGRVSYDLSRHAIPMIIANGIKSDDDRLRCDAEAYMNELGRQGNLALEAKVLAFLEGRVGLDDLDE